MAQSKIRLPQVQTHSALVRPRNILANIKVYSYLTTNKEYPDLTASTEAVRSGYTLIFIRYQLFSLNIQGLNEFSDKLSIYQHLESMIFHPFAPLSQLFAMKNTFTQILPRPRLTQQRGYTINPI